MQRTIKTQLNVKVPVTLKKKLTLEAVKKDMKITELVEAMLVEYLERR